ncbi:ABC transporter permease [Actomonas aquatica]|uniref:ABC transporter permease n=1 Tax=Actomonas aquatica TaxID=2866162 RepID=A0ABZ1C9K7_9BACT|nr:ABC transporter permease [Opitutus sp. WL0086]WRQ88376.1 ABC transporter permease [Opitutus sp. WL0086]
MLDTFLQDLKIGFRVLQKEKSFCALAVFVLALGIGGVTTQYAVVKGALFHSFDFPQTEQLVDVQMVDPEGFQPTNFNSRMTTSDFADLRDNLTSFKAFTGYLNGSTINLTYQNLPRRYTGGYVSWDFFRTLGVSPVIGRDFLPEEDQPGVNKAVLISDSLWKSDFGSDPGVIGRAVRVNGTPGEIVGIMPPGFNFPTNEQLWIPVNSSFPVRPRNDPNVNFIAVLARLADGVTLEQAQTEVTAMARQFAADFPDTNEQFTLGYVRPMGDAFTPNGIRGMLLAMLGICVVVLLIACVNVMNMQFARATLRAKELAIRSSLGATRSRLIRQMLTESLLLAALGATVGIGIAMWGTDAIDTFVHAGTNPIPSWMTFHIDPTVLVVVVAVTAFSAVISGFVPAWMSSRASSMEVLKEGGRGNTSRGVMLITRGLVVAQIFMTCVLLLITALQLRSVHNQQSIDYGYDTNSVLAARMGLMEGDYPTSAERQVFYERLVRELEASGQFESVALTNRFRMVFSGNGPVEIEGQDYLDDSDRQRANFENISAGFFDTVGLRILEGRNFTEMDSDQREPIAIVNSSFARKYFEGESAVGRRFRTIQQNGQNAGPWRRIVGVVGDMRMQGPFNTQIDESGFYVPYFASAFGPIADAPIAQQFGTVVVKPRGNQRPEALATTLQNQVNRVDPNLPLYFVESPQSSIDGYTAQNAVVVTMFGLFGIISVSLAAVGLYGVMSFSVNQRTQEFGVRLALGASARDVLGMVIRQAGIQLAIGLGIGTALVLGVAVIVPDVLNQILQLNNVNLLAADIYLGVGALLIVVAAIAAFVPARRATRVDPMIALRSE